MTGHLVAISLLFFSLQALGEHDNLKRVAHLTRVKRVIGGSDVETGSWPHLVHLRGKIPVRYFWGIPVAYKNYYCGGSVLDKRWVLTAAHCFEVPNAPAKIKTPKYWHIKAGEVERSHDVLDKLRHYAGSIFGRRDWLLWYLHAEKIILHPQFNPAANWKHDVALIRLEKDLPVETDPNIDIIDLQEDSNWPPADTRCYMKGWGCELNGGPLTDTAQVAELPIKNNSVCDSLFGPISDLRLCAGENMQNLGICRGDSGGPLVCDNAGTWKQVGIASFTSASDPGAVPGVFTRVAEYRTWILDTIQNNS